jgi:hypothetical protein
VDILVNARLVGSAHLRAEIAQGHLESPLEMCAFGGWPSSSEKPIHLSHSPRRQIVSARTTLPQKNPRSDDHFDESFAFYRKWKANPQTKRKE